MSEKLNIFDNTGASVGEYTLEDQYLEFEKGEQAVHDTVIAILAAERAGTGSSKTRSERRGGGIKPFRQKGTGRARSGSIRNPIWRGGGIIFGPKPRSFAKKINKKVRQLALKRAFTARVSEGAVTLLNTLELADNKTKSVVQILKALELNNASVLLVVKDYNDNLLQATANLAGVKKNTTICIKASSVNVYQMLRYKKVLFTQEAMDEFVQRLV